MLEHLRASPAMSRARSSQFTPITSGNREKDDLFLVTAAAMSCGFRAITNHEVKIFWPPLSLRSERPQSRVYAYAYVVKRLVSGCVFVGA